MTQADSVHSTPPTNTPIDTTRRRFLSQAAAVAAGGAALGVALPLPVSAGDSQRVPDPILGLIEAHKAARAGVYSAVDALNAVEDELFDEGLEIFRQSKGDPRRTRCEAALSQACAAETDIACALVTERPTTMAGVLALLAYASAADTDGEGWPAELYGDDDTCRSWQFFLIERLAEVLPGLVSRGGLV